MEKSHHLHSHLNTAISVIKSDRKLCKYCKKKEKRQIKYSIKKITKQYKWINKEIAYSIQTQQYYIKLQSYQMIKSDFKENKLIEKISIQNVPPKCSKCKKHSVYIIATKNIYFKYHYSIPINSLMSAIIEYIIYQPTSKKTLTKDNINYIYETLANISIYGKEKVDQKLNNRYSLSLYLFKKCAESISINKRRTTKATQLLRMACGIISCKVHKSLHKRKQKCLCCQRKKEEIALKHTIINKKKIYFCSYLCLKVCWNGNLFK